MYQSTESTAYVIRVADRAIIPTGVSDNMGTLAFLAWLEEGNEPAPYEPPEPGVPSEVTKRQALQALILAGLDDQVETMLAAMPGVAGKLARAEWRESNTVRRDRPLVAQMGAALGLTSEQLDDLFISAGGLS